MAEDEKSSLNETTSQLSVSESNDTRQKGEVCLSIPDEKEEKSVTEEIDFIHAEGGWGWIVVLATGYCFGCLMGMINNYALIYNEFDKVYNGTPNHIFYAAWIGSASTGIQYLSCIPGSMLTDIFGARRIGFIGGLLSAVSLFACAPIQNIKLYFITFAFGYGIGQALLLSATLSILPHYFNKRLSLANGLMTLIGTIVVVLLPVGTAEIIEKFGLKESFYFLGMINLLTMFMALTFKSKLPNNRKETICERVRLSLGLEVWLNRKFLIWCFGSVIGQFCYLTPIIIINHHSENVFPNNNPVIINVVFAICSGLGGFVFGKIGDWTKFNRIHYHTAVFLVYAIGQLIIPNLSSFYMLVFWMGVLAIFDGVWLTFLVPISFDIVESSTLANQAAGFHHAAISLPSIIGPAVAGKLFEIYNSYDVAFYLCSTVGFIAVFFQILLLADLRFMKKIIGRNRLVK